MPADDRSMVFAGSLAQRFGRGGSTWARLQWVLGFRKLGWKVLYLDRIDPSSCTDEAGNPCPPAHSAALRYFVKVMEGFGLGSDCALVSDDGDVVHGPERGELLERLGASAFLMNVMGYVRDEDILSAANRRIFLDIDPGFGQMWRNHGLADIFQGHDDHVTIGENIGQEGCTIPTCGLSWITAPQPVVLDEWPWQRGVPQRYTSVVSWRGAYGPVEHEGSTYGLRVHEFRKFAGLPRQSRSKFEIALDIDLADARDLQILRDCGWTVTNPRAMAGDPWRYRSYIQGSRGEFTVAKNMYVESRSGWFSDRTMCYLASGRPAIVQDTGFTQRYPAGEGLIAFSNLEEAARALESVEKDYERHSKAARRLAETHFASEVVIGRLLERLGVSP
jgi:hypothetical protein